MEDLFGGIALREIVDVAIVAFLAYRVIIYLKGSILLRLVAVFAVVITLYLVSIFLNLPILLGLTQHILQSSLLILVIVFHHDIRKWFSAGGRLKGRSGLAGEPFVDEILAAVNALSQKRIGALLVIQRETPIDHLIDVGTDIDAKVTCELITSIFLPYSPIHDGAVIIQNGKLTRAGCFLPLSQNPTLSKSLGTRHRAAIGLTELNDAVVIVVSEENGKISLVCGGKIQGGLDSTALAKGLRKLL